jgi:hypothetical protein
VGTTGDWVYQIQVETTGDISDHNPRYQFTAAVVDYQLMWFTVEVLWPNDTQDGGNQYQNLQGDLTGDPVYVNNPNQLVAIEIYPVLTNGVLTAVDNYVYVGENLNQTVPIALPSDDTISPWVGFDAQASPWAYQNDITGLPGTDPLVNFGNSASGYFRSYDPSTQGLVLDTTCTGFVTVEDSNMEYESEDCGSGSSYSICTQELESPSSGGDTLILVKTINEAGNPISGYYVGIEPVNDQWATSGYSNNLGIEFITGTDLNLTYNDEYKVYADSYGSCTFEQWGDGSGDPDYVYAQAQVLTATYFCTGEEPYITVDSVDQNGPITGYFTQLWLGSSEIATGYTPNTFGPSVFNSDDYGDTYAVYADSYGSCTFEYWQGPGNSGAYYIDVTSTTAMTITAYYDCT